MHIPWEAAELFLAAAEHRSLAKAAAKLRVTQPTVSRRLAELEQRLGEPLFLRSVEGVTLTAFGERLLPAARMMAEAHGELSRAAAGRNGSPIGVVNVTAPPGIAYELLAPFAVLLRSVLPDVQLSVNASIRQVDLVRREADLALRASKPATRDLVTLGSVEEPIAAFGSKAYVASLPRAPALSDIAWVAWPSSHDDVPPNPQLAARIPDFRPAFAADDFLVQLRAAELGAGAIILSTRSSRLNTGRTLVPIPVSLGAQKAGIHLVCARSALSVPRVRAVAELLQRELSSKGRVPR